MGLKEELMALYQEKITCFEGLLDVLDREAEVLKSGDVTPLWILAEEKQAAAAAILAVRERIIQTMSLAGRTMDVDGMHFQTDLLAGRLSFDEKKVLEPFFLAVHTLREQVKNTADANLGYVRLCLDVVGEMMSAFMQPRQQAGYDRNRRMAGAANGYVNRRV
ncbi:flagellar protein FlgN [Desulfobotulus sp. H1]|uniref:Flagellar protein FlgN n=1 Tax=Desulfobotulus pelophilus TaxID=2823377 RepID=A0ABT3N4K0_9BACT|nr:flagellar export chaperone FlgN [Desulfobotulus pelophilus]MCW7752379.1 flagellar protein FlgN [Desulfobotulus pelophilus]